MTVSLFFSILTLLRSVLGSAAIVLTFFFVRGNVIELRDS